MERDEETEWILAAQNGDIGAFGKLAAKYQNMIFTLAKRILNNKHDAEDLSQEVLIKLFKSLPQYKAQAAFGAWVYRITYNESLNKIRKKKRNKETYDVTENEKENWTETKNVLDTIEAKDRKAIITDALDQLAESDRFLIMAYYFEELPIKEISDMTSLSESNIKIKLHRSRKSLFNILNTPILKEHRV